LTNKIEKTFVDYWLLDYDEAMSRFDDAWKLSCLNAFEQCLLVHHLVSAGKKERAKQIADSLRDKTTAPSIEVMNRIYGTVLNMNSLNSKPSDDLQS